MIKHWLVVTLICFCTVNIVLAGGVAGLRSCKKSSVGFRLASFPGNEQEKGDTGKSAVCAAPVWEAFSDIKEDEKMSYPVPVEYVVQNETVPVSSYTKPPFAPPRLLFSFFK